MRLGSPAIAAVAVAPYLLLASSGDQTKASFSADVAPLLKAHCASCHTGSEAAAGLDLTNPDSIKTVVKAKNSKGSVLVQRLKGIGGAKMPMGFAPLSDAKIARIAAWIDQGAVFDKAAGKHWAYVPPVKPKPPTIPSSWIRNPIDAFVLEKLNQSKLNPSREAPKETLIRRLHLDLIGIPPSPKEIDAFLADKRPDAYERLVDKLIQSPQYGERQALPWLDLSRYADSNGYEKDGLRSAWLYRDWLVKAFNQNLPYDRFTVEQLAGDLLPNPTVDQLVATGFNRNTMFNMEGGVDQEEAHFNVVLDRVGTTSTVWLGSTLQCARCHDHKYDPFSQRDFYKMAAFFSNSVILPRGPKNVGEEKWFESEIKVPSPEQEAKLAALNGDLVKAKNAYEGWTSENQKSMERWFDWVRAGDPWTPFSPDKMHAGVGTVLAKEAGDVIVASGETPHTEDYVIAGPAKLSRIAAVKIEVLPDPRLVNNGPGRSNNGNFVLTGIKISVDGKPAEFGRARASYYQNDFHPKKVFGGDPNFGWAILNGQGRDQQAVFELKQPVDANPSSLVTVTLEQRWPGGKHSIGRLRVSLTGSDNAAEYPLTPLLVSAMTKFKDVNQEPTFLQGQFRLHSADFDRLQDRVTNLQAEIAALERAIPTALVMKDKPAPGPLTTNLHERGEFLSKGPLVEAGYPDVIAGAVKVEKPKNRLSLARWIASKNHPLTARVQVNRMWEQLFGRGLVETSEDFGTQGSKPTHPKLLDWLACEFMDRGWDMKAMMRLIVTSATYRQSSNATPALIARDPANALLARGPRFRLDAELIRDSSLAAAGLLSRKMGGPSVYPYQPEGVWDSPFNGERWIESKGEDRYRRGIYTLMKRTAPYPSFMSFDATSRESCTVRRIRTNTPLQALAMLNDKVVMEAATGLAGRMSREGGPTDIARLRYGFRLCTGRIPKEQEMKALAKALGSLRKRYAANPEAAAKVAGSPEQAAWTMVGNILLNLDEAVTKQ